MATVLLRSVGERFITQVTTEHHAFIADEPQPIGDELGPSPYEFLLGALGACTSMTVMMYARRQDWPLTDVQVELTHERTHLADCEECEDPAARIELIQRRIHLEGPLTDEQRTRLMEVAVRCPVHKTLTGQVRIVDASY